MNNFIFHSPTKVYFGRGYEKQIGSLLKSRFSSTAAAALSDPGFTML